MAVSEALQSSCCPRPRRVAAPVDRLLPDTGLRLRHLPGEVCLSCRDVQAPVVAPTPALAAEISRCLGGDPSVLTVVKAVPAAHPDGPRPCPICAAPAEGALLDVALGESAGLVAERLAGHWCWSCMNAVLSGSTDDLLDRLARFDPSADGPAVPSLVYDTPAHPRSVQMEITTRCNLTCAYCSHRELTDKSDVPFERFLALLDKVDVARVDNVDFTGLGEPVMHRDLPAMVREVLRRGHPTDVRVVTNGTVMIPKRFEPLVEAGITSIAFSIDSLDPETFARSRGGARLEPVLENLEALVAYRERNGVSGLRIKIKAVLIDEPYAEAERLLAYSARLGLEMPHFSCIDTRANAEAIYDQPWLQESDDWAAEGGSALMAWAVERWRELAPDRPVEGSVERSEPSAAERAAGFHHPMLMPPPDLCRWAVDATMVAAGGSVLSCCEQMIDLPRQSFGALAGAPLGALWTGDLLWGYRLPLALGLLPRGCVGCPKAPAGGLALETAFEASKATGDPRSGRTSPPG